MKFYNTFAATELTTLHFGTAYRGGSFAADSFITKDNTLLMPLNDAHLGSFSF